MPRKTTDGRWLVDIRPYGANGPRIRKKFSSKAEASRFEAFKLNEAIHEPWNPGKADNRKLTELGEMWFNNHGIHLAAGSSHKKTFDEFALFTGNKQARLVTPDDWFRYRAKKLDDDTSKSTLNTYLTRIKTVFNKLHKSGVIAYENPIKHVEALRLQEKEQGFLSEAEIRMLLTNLQTDSHDLYVMAVICLSTGARWMEAYNLTETDLIGNLIQFKETKSKKIRKVPISAEVKALVLAWLKVRTPWVTSRHQFAKLMRSYGLKKQFYQSTHILRHSFAAHFVMNGGHLMTLKSILGHSDIATTMRYAHLSPDHLEEAINLNPLANGHNVDTV